MTDGMANMLLELLLPAFTSMRVNASRINVSMPHGEYNML